MFAGTPDEVEAQIGAAVAAGARNFDGAIDADLPSTKSGSRGGRASSCLASAAAGRRTRDAADDRPHDPRRARRRAALEGRFDVGIDGGADRLRRPRWSARDRGRRACSMHAGCSSSPAAWRRTPTSTSRCTAAGRRRREVWLQSPEGATRAALFGGTTTVVSFAFMDVHVEAQAFDASVAVEHRARIFDARSHTDFAFHPVFTGTPSDRDARHDRRCRRGRHGDLQVLHDRSHDHAVGNPARQRLGSGVACAMRATWRDRDGARRRRRPDQAHGGEAPPRAAYRAAQRSPRAHERRRGDRRPHGRTPRRARGATLYVAHVCGKPALDCDRRAPRRTATHLRRSAAQLHVLLPGRLRRGGRREVSHRDGTRPPEDGRRCGRATRGASLDARARTSTRPRTRSRWPAPTSSPRPAVTSGSRRAASSASLKASTPIGFTLAALRRGLLHEPGASYRHVSAEGDIAEGSDADVVLGTRTSNAKSRCGTCTMKATTARGRAGASAVGRS